jgi:hypothetical protein
MGARDDTKGDATGAALFANDKWLVTNILSADSWADGTAEDLLNGSAWRRFTERLAQLADRIQAPDVPSRADGYRYLATLVRNAFDVAIEDLDPERPRFNWLTRRNKIGYDCPDALYGNVIIRDDRTYRITGKRGNVHFLGLQVMASMRSLHNTHADEWQTASDGSFEVIAGGHEREGDWIPLAPGADTIWVRQFFYDWERESPAPLWIDCLDAPRSSPSGILDPGFFARRLDAVATNVEANVDLWLGVARAQRDHLRNRFPPAAFGGSEIGAQKHQTAGVGYFALDDDEALIIEVTPPRARYWSIDLCNFWLESLDYANHQSSLNGHQAVLDPDGGFRAVVAHRDPGVTNWLDTVGHGEGTMIYRWNLTDAAPVPSTRVVRFQEIDSHLPAGTRRVTAEERARQIEIRREHVRRRSAGPV